MPKRSGRKNVFRVGLLSSRLRMEIRDEAFLKGLREIGYVEGQYVVIGWRFAEEELERLAALAAELVSLKVNVIVTIDHELCIGCRSCMEACPYGARTFHKHEATITLRTAP